MTAVHDGSGHWEPIVPVGPPAHLGATRSAGRHSARPARAVVRGSAGASRTLGVAASGAPAGGVSGSWTVSRATGVATSPPRRGFRAGGGPMPARLRAGGRGSPATASAKVFVDARGSDHRPMSFGHRTARRRSCGGATRGAGADDCGGDGSSGEADAALECRRRRSGGRRRGFVRQHGVPVTTTEPPGRHVAADHVDPAGGVGGLFWRNVVAVGRAPVVSRRTMAVATEVGVDGPGEIVVGRTRGVAFRRRRMGDLGPPPSASMSRSRCMVTIPCCRARHPRVCRRHGRARCRVTRQGSG